MPPAIHSFKSQDSTKFKTSTILRKRSGKVGSKVGSREDGESGVGGPAKSLLLRDAGQDSSIEASEETRGEIRFQGGFPSKNWTGVASEASGPAGVWDQPADMVDKHAVSSSVVRPSTAKPVSQRGANTNTVAQDADKSHLVSNHGVRRTTNSDDGGRDNMTKTLSMSEADTFNGGQSENQIMGRDQFVISEPCLYTHRMFVRAAKIFKFLLQDDSKGGGGGAVSGRTAQDVGQGGDIPEIQFENPQEQIKTFELTFATMKFQQLFSTILEQTGFFNDFPNFSEEYSLVCVILFDLQSRKYQKRKPFPNERLDELCLEIETALLAKKTRLQSHVAKERIKHAAPSIEYLLPEQVREKDETKTNTPVYLWVNQIKTTLEDTIAELEGEGFTRLAPGEDVSEHTGRVFKMDLHCPDLLVFPPSLDLYLKETKWVKTGHLVQQDKSSCLGPQSVQPLLGLDQDVIHVNVSTGVTTAHVASLLKSRSPHSHIWGYGVDSPEKAKKAAKNLEFLGAKNTKILMDNFLNVDPDEPRLRSVRVILISANCSKSAITSPVQFIVSEEEDMRFLGELSKGDQGTASVATLMLEHEKILRHALKFPRVQAVVYTTRSRYEAENEVVVTRALEFVNSSNINRGFKVTPPVLAFGSEEIGAGSSGVDDMFVRFLPSDKSNGCFVAVITREPEDPKDVARSAIARARSRGLLGKAKSVAQIAVDGDSTSQDTDSAEMKRNKSGYRKLKGTTSKVQGHRSPAAISTRLYQTGLSQKVNLPAKTDNSRPEHLKIVKHPAPFR